MKGFLALLGFISALFLSYQLLKLFVPKNDYLSRLRKYTNVEEIKEGRKKFRRRDSGMGLGSSLSREIGKIKFLDKYKGKVQANLSRAHILLKSEEYMTLCLILFFVSASIVIMVEGIHMWPLALVAGIIGWILPSFVVKSRIKKRIKLLNEQLGDALTMMSNSLKAGYSFFQTVDMVAEEMTGPIAEEFVILKKEVNLGLNTEKALENMVNRVSSEDLELVATAVMIQRQVGGNLSEVLDNITATIRDRVRIRGELKTITAQGRVSGLVISLLPFVLCILIYLINPKQMGLLFTRPLGLIMVGFALFMETIGILLIRKVVKIEI
ncbi:MAG TPA: type II secretion system F family protein [Clostridia bacterium]|nr:type II secretion system F family protein [Clostridia bacterium]